MKPLVFLSLPLLLLTGASLAAQDLSKLDRRIAKEPVYQTKHPKYCLLVFGPEAKHRVWLVHDGDTLYVDRNGNGDLTEPGKKVMARKGEFTDPKRGIYDFAGGDIQEGSLIHKKLRLNVSDLEEWSLPEEVLRKYRNRNPPARCYSLSLMVELPAGNGMGKGERFAHLVEGIDDQGLLVWGDSPAKAPVLHFRGPWRLLPEEEQSLTIGEETSFGLNLVSLGLGPGTTAQIICEDLVPETAHPIMEITYPPQHPGGPRVTERFALKERGNPFVLRGCVQTSEKSGTGKATVRLTFDALRVGKVIPTTFEVNVLPPEPAYDLTKLDRRIAKEPVYQTKHPKYCLLVFGPEAKHRVWLVHDGDTLYVDRNGNGDLTEPGKKVTATKGDYTDPKEGGVLLPGRGHCRR
jgi:hypothetical protein